MWHDHAQKELDHINAVISHLEHRGARSEIAPTSAVVQVDYWRTRIRAVLTLPDTPKRITDQAAILLARLKRVATARRESVKSQHAKAAA